MLIWINRPLPTFHGRFEVLTCMLFACTLQPAIATQLPINFIFIMMTDDKCTTYCPPGNWKLIYQLTLQALHWSQVLHNSMYIFFYRKVGLNYTNTPSWEIVLGRKWIRNTYSYYFSSLSLWWQEISIRYKLPRLRPLTKHKLMAINCKNQIS